MSEIKRPVQLVLSRTAWDAYDGGEEIHVWSFVDADGNTVSDSEIVAALNGQPDGGDVALQIAYSSTLTHANELLDKLHTAEAERDALAAEAATLRGALEFAVGVRSLAADRALTLPTVRGILNDVTKAAKRALATPASPATARYAALEELWASTKRFEDAQHAGEDHMALALAKADFDTAGFHLRALDGDAT